MLDPYKVNPRFQASPISPHVSSKHLREARDDVFHLQICAAYVGQDAGTRCRQHRRESNKKHPA